MPKRCPPGVICIENVTIVVIVVVLIVAYYYYYTKLSTGINMSKSEYTKEFINEVDRSQGIFSRLNHSYSNIQNDILLNPYVPPHRDNRVSSSNLDPRGEIQIPINISTSAVDATYRQVGILKRENGSEMILPLMGRPLFTNRDKWQFYTLNENNIKLPITFKQKSCTSEYGCDNIYTGDTVYVEGIDSVFKVTMYDATVFKYIPFV